MTWVITVLMLSGVMLSTSAWAQGNSETASERPATASYWGDTGLWFLPTAEVLRPRGWSFSLYRTELDFEQGQTDVSDWPLTAAVGAGPRTEVFGALRVLTRIDRDTRPLFAPAIQTEAGLVNDRPFVRETWTGNDLGDLFLGAKVNLLSEHRNQPLALGLRGTVKVPTADDDGGAGTGEFDYFADVIVSKEMRRAIELTGFSGMVFRGDPGAVSISDGLRWGVGAAFGARANLRFTTEVYGEVPFDSEVTAPEGVLTGVDGSRSPFLSELASGVVTAAGITWQHSSGVSLGAGLTYSFNTNEDLGELKAGDVMGIQFRVGFHRGVRVYAPPAPPRIVTAEPPPPAPPIAAAPEPPPQPTTPAPVDSDAAGDIAFADIQFDLDEYALRPDAIPILDRALETLRRNPTIHLTLEGHACDLGTAEYNLALGDRRAHAVRDYLVSRGIAASRLQTVTYGEDRPKYDNSREVTRRLNRRVEFDRDLQDDEPR